MREDKSLSLKRRKSSRLKDKIFIFGKFRLSPTTEFKAFTENISAGGLMFEIERNIPIQSELELEMYQPMVRDKRVIFSIPTLARVKWLKKIEKDNFQQGENRYRVGIEFSEIKEEDRKIIATYIQRRTSEK